MAIKYRVLSIDGGGMRGIIPVCFLKELEVRTGKQLYELFDFIVGSSIGGITAIAIANKFNADKLLELFKTQSANVFNSSLIRELCTGGGLFQAKYDRAGLDAILDKYFGNKLLSEVDLPICVTSYDLDEQSPVIWSSLRAKPKTKTDAKLKDIAGATSAATTYLPAKVFYDEAGVLHRSVDGGLFLNNPQMLPYFELSNYDENLSKKDILLISMGAGNVPIGWKVEKLLKAGKLGWILDGNIIELMMDGNSDFANLVASAFYPNHYRMQIDLPKELGEIDDTSPAQINGLIAQAKKYINENSDMFDEIAKQLVANHNESEMLVSSMQHYDCAI